MAEKKILIVDYDKKSLEDLASLLLAHNLQTVEAYDGQQAYEKYKSESPDLVILEAMLPKLHGFDLAHKIHEDTKGRVPVIIVTGLYRGPQYRNEAIRSFGAADYFEKPFDKEKLIGSVLELLHDEVDIEEDLPDPETVIELVRQLGQKVSQGGDKK